METIFKKEIKSLLNLFCSLYANIFAIFKCQNYEINIAEMIFDFSQNFEVNIKIVLYSISIILKLIADSENLFR